MNTKTLLLTLLLPLAGCALPTSSQAATGPSSRNQTQVTRTLALSGFDTITLSGCDLAMVRQGTSFAVSAQGEQRDLDLLKAETRGKRLVLGRKNGRCDNGTDPVVIEITLPDLRSVELSGATSMVVEPFSTPRFHATVSGASELDLMGFETQQAALRLSGASQLHVDGLTTDTFALDLSGAAQSDFTGHTWAVSISGSGTNEANAQRLCTELRATATSCSVSIGSHSSLTVTHSDSGVSRVCVEDGLPCPDE